VSVPSSTCSEATKDTIILETEKPQEDLMKQPVAETEIKERVKCELCDRHIIVPLSYASFDCRRCVMPIIRTYLIYGLQVDIGFQSTVIYLHVSHPPNLSFLLA
jgi:hypothetical protein